jgi:hypothetical protein
LNNIRYEVAKLVKSLGLEEKTANEIIGELTIYADGKEFPVTISQYRGWQKYGIPVGYIEKIIENGKIPNAESDFGVDGRRFDSSVKQIDVIKRVRDLLSRDTGKVRSKDIDKITGKARALQEIKRSETPGAPTYSPGAAGKSRRLDYNMLNEVLGRYNSSTGKSLTMEEFTEGMSGVPSGFSSGRAIARAGREAAESLSSGGKAPNNGAPEYITPKMQSELIYWAERQTRNAFARSVSDRFNRSGELSSRQWTALLRMHDSGK